MLAGRKGAPDTNYITNYTQLAGVMDRSNYPRILARWSEFIPPERIFIMFMDQIEKEPVSVMQRACGFLGVAYRESCFRHLYTPIHVGEPTEIPPQIYTTLKDQARPIYEGLWEQFPDVVGQWMRRHYGL